MDDSPSLPRVSIVILTWNQREDTQVCLDSLQQLTYSNYEVIVVDNGSTDGTQEVIRARYPRVTLLAQDHNLGGSGGRNVGIRHALKGQTDYILFLDNDTLVKPNILSRLIEVGESNAKIGVLGSTIYYYHDRQRIWNAGARVDRRTGLCYPLRNGELDLGTPRSVEEVDFLATCSLMAKRIVFETVGIFDEEYFFYYEDTDWCVRASDAGYRIVVVPDSVLWHKESQSLGGPSSPGKIYYMTRNQLLFVVKRFSGRRMLPMLVRMLLDETRTIVLHSILPRYRSLRPQRDARMHGVIDFLRGRYGSRNMPR